MQFCSDMIEDPPTVTQSQPGGRGSNSSKWRERPIPAERKSDQALDLPRDASGAWTADTCNRGALLARRLSARGEPSALTSCRRCIQMHGEIARRRRLPVPPPRPRRRAKAGDAAANPQHSVVSGLLWSHIGIARLVGRLTAAPLDRDKTMPAARWRFKATWRPWPRSPVATSRRAAGAV
jgi:hypothetical protein